MPDIQIIIGNWTLKITFPSFSVSNGSQIELCVNLTYTKVLIYKHVRILDKSLFNSALPLYPYKMKKWRRILK